MAYQLHLALPPDLFERPPRKHLRLEIGIRLGIEMAHQMAVYGSDQITFSLSRL